jgi:hypothetical protein
LWNGMIWLDNTSQSKQRMYDYNQMIGQFNYPMKRVLPAREAKSKRQRREHKCYLPLDIWIIIWEFISSVETYHKIKRIQTVNNNDKMWRNALCNTTFHSAGRVSMAGWSPDAVTRLQYRIQSKENFFRDTFYMGQVEHLSIFTYKNKIGRLRGWQNLVGLKCIRLGGCRITDADLEMICSLPNLSVFKIGSGHRITNSGLHVIGKLYKLSISMTFTSTGMFYLRNVEKMNLIGSTGDIDNGLRYMTTTKKLTLSGTPGLTDDGLRHLKSVVELYVNHCFGFSGIGFANLVNLQVLCAADCDVDDSGLQYLGNVKYINIAGCVRINDDGLKHLTNVEHLNISRTRVTGKGLIKLQKLTELVAINCRILFGVYISKIQTLRRLTADGCPLFCSMDLNSLKNLEKLSAIECESIRELDLGELPLLRELKISDCDDNMLKNATNLRSLVVYGHCSITDVGLSYLRNIELLSLVYVPRITDKGLKALENVVELGVGGCHDITGSGLLYLTKNKKLRECMVYAVTGFRHKYKEMLRKEGCHIYYTSTY